MLQKVDRLVYLSINQLDIATYRQKGGHIRRLIALVSLNLTYQTESLLFLAAKTHHLLVVVSFGCDLFILVPNASKINTAVTST